jgi:hypothetical protein
LSKGNNIVVNGEHAKGRRYAMFNGTGAVLYPGTVMQIDTSVALKGGLWTAVLYDRDADGDQPKGAYWIATDEMGRLSGRTKDDPIAVGELFEAYSPLPGDDLNLMIQDASTGTSLNDVAIGTILMVDDGTGTLIATTATPESEVALLMEDVSDMSGNRLGWVQWSGK